MFVVRRRCTQTSREQVNAHVAQLRTLDLDTVGSIGNRECIDGDNPYRAFESRQRRRTVGDDGRFIEYRPLGENHKRHRTSALLEPDRYDLRLIDLGKFLLFSHSQFCTLLHEALVMLLQHLDLVVQVSTVEVMVGNHYDLVGERKSGRCLLLVQVL